MKRTLSLAVVLLPLVFAQCSTPPLRTEVAREEVTKVQSAALIMVGMGAPDEPSYPIATALSIKQNMRNRGADIDAVFRSRSGRMSEQLAEALKAKLSWKTLAGADLLKHPGYPTLKTQLPAQSLDTGNPGFKKLILADGDLHLFPAMDADYPDYFLSNSKDLDVAKKVCATLKTDSVVLNYNRYVVSALQDTASAFVSLESTVIVVSKEGKVIATATLTTPAAYIPIGQPDSYNQILGLYGQWIGKLVDQIKEQSSR